MDRDQLESLVIKLFLEGGDPAENAKAAISLVEKSVRHQLTSPHAILNVSLAFRREAHQPTNMSNIEIASWFACSFANFLREKENTVEVS